MKAVHFIERFNHVRVLDHEANLYETGYWDVSLAKAKALVGSRLYLHRAQKARSFFGGHITGYRIQPEGEYAGRIVFTVISDKAGKGARAPSGWGQEKNYTDEPPTTERIPK